jgi:hypothetical protein
MVNLGNFGRARIYLSKGSICMELCGHLILEDSIAVPILDECNWTPIAPVYPPFVVIHILTAEVNNFRGTRQTCNRYSRLVLVCDRHYDVENGLQENL